jgi:hypothetical protein
MADNQLLAATSTAEGVKSLTENLFANKSRWVHLWIYKRAAPFLALSAFYIGRHRLSYSPDFDQIPAWFFPVLAFVISCYAISRIFLARNSWETLYGSYVFSFAYMSLGEHLNSLMSNFYDPFAPPEGLLSWIAISVQWVYGFGGFWGMTWLYCKRLIAPEEFLALVLFITFAYGVYPDPSRTWIFVAVLLIPAIFLLYRQKQSFRMVVFLSAILVYFWITSEIAGFYVLIALAICLGFIWVLFRALKKLSEENVSNLVYSFCLATFSGLVFFIFNGLLGFDPSFSLTWWAMWFTFTVISALVWRSCGSRLFPILALWFSYWMTATFYVSLENLSDNFSELTFFIGSLLILIGGALIIRATSLTLDSNRLYIWSRIYMIAAAILAIIISTNEQTLSSVWYFFIFACFPIAVWCAQKKSLGRGLPWWRGVVNPRTIVAVRRITRKSGSWFVSIPFIGTTVSAVIKVVALIAHLKKNGERSDSADLLLIVWSTSVALIFAYYIDETFGPGAYGELNLAEEEFYFVVSAMISGILLSLIGRISKEPMFPLLGMLAFIAAPMYLFQLDGEVTITFWLVTIASACGVVFVKDVVQIN